MIYVECRSSSVLPKHRRSGIKFVEWWRPRWPRTSSRRPTRRIWQGDSAPRATSGCDAKSRRGKKRLEGRRSIGRQLGQRPRNSARAPSARPAPCGTLRRTPSPDALPTLLHGVAVSDENDPHVANSFAPVRAPPIPPSGPIVVQTQRVKAQASRPTASAFARAAC